jgi:hypothetical protein
MTFHPAAAGWRDYSVSPARGGSVVAYVDRTAAVYNVVIRTYDLNGEHLKAWGTGVKDNLTDPAVAMDKDGNYVVAYTRDASGTKDVFVDRFTFGAAGAYLGGAYVAGTSASEYAPSVAMTEMGRFVVTYTCTYGTGRTAVAGALFAADGTKVKDFVVASRYVMKNFHSEVACAPDGQFAVVYRQGNKIMLKRFDKDANRRGTAILVSNTPSSFPGVDLAMGTKGHSIVTWLGMNPGTASVGVFARTILNTGVPLASRLVGAEAGINARFPTVALNPANGHYLVAYVAGPKVVIKGFANGFVPMHTETLAAIKAPALAFTDACVDEYFAFYNKTEDSNVYGMMMAM